MQNFAQISGLRIEENWRVPNGEDSYVIPFPSNHPFNVVFHGNDKFDYGHYGIHLGQEDRLTFLGDSTKIFKGFFVDTRANSSTKGNKLLLELSPSSKHCLCIPPGVAHAFEGLESINTVNSYKLYLPEPEDWANGTTQWNMENDVINLPMQHEVPDIQYFVPNNNLASDVFYEIVPDHQRKNIPLVKYEYPMTEEVSLPNGENYRLTLKKKRDSEGIIKEWEEIEGIKGLGWARHLVIWSGKNSGFIPFLDKSPYYVVDHGETAYSHDAYGIHLGQEDRLTFLGDENQDVILRLVDCREGSETLHNELTVSFNPSPLKYLVIPNGVAHSFENLQRVFTINRPQIFADELEEYEPGNDVIDWDLENTNYPSFKVSNKLVPDSYYVDLAQSQRDLIEKPAQHSTPVILYSKDESGQPVRVAMRKKAV